MTKMTANNIPTSDHDLLIRLDTRLDSMTKSLENYHVLATAGLAALEVRVGALEKKEEIREGVNINRKNTRSELYALGLILSTIIGSIIGWFLGYLHK